MALAMNQQNPDTLYAGTTDGVFKTINRGDLWLPASSGLTETDLRSLAIDPLLPDTLYAGTFGSGVFKSTDEGDSWQAANTNMTTAFVYALAIHPITTTILYAGTFHGVFKSMDGGDHWSQVGLSNQWITALAIDPNHPGTIYAGANSSGVYKSLNDGGTWEAMNAGLNNVFIRSLAIRSASSTPIYAGTLGGVFVYYDLPEQLYLPLVLNTTL